MLVTRGILDHLFCIDLYSVGALFSVQAQRSPCTTQESILFALAPHKQSSTAVRCNIYVGPKEPRIAIFRGSLSQSRGVRS